jgi:anti-sigma regulatory factor (Ser/Thr protein kinase)
MITIAAGMRTIAPRAHQSRSARTAQGRANSRTAWVLRTEDRIVSHNLLLAASGKPEMRTGPRPFAAADLDDSGPAGEHAVTCELGPQPESVKAGRDFTRIALQHWGLGEVADAAELVVSELVTNALRHGLLSARRMPGEHPIGLRLLRQTPYLMCLVTDPGADIPVRADSGDFAESGRGLHVIESCCLQWGWQALDADRKVVWALLAARELPVPGPRGARRARCSGLSSGRAAPCPAAQAGSRPAWHPGYTCALASPVRRAGRRSRRPWRP